MAVLADPEARSEQREAVLEQVRPVRLRVSQARRDGVKLSSSDHPTVTLEEAKARLIAFRDSKVGMSARLHYPNALARVIWPGHRMTSQGSGFAAAGLLRRIGAPWRWDPAGQKGGYYLGALK